MARTPKVPLKTEVEAPPAAQPDAPRAAPPAAASASKRTTKIDEVIALLRREEGATLADMIEATSWLPHTTRAALTGLKKKGHVLDKAKRGDVTCYRIVAVAG
jgi:hypothetical protein